MKKGELLFYLNSKQEKLIALECRKLAFDEKYGIGYYLDQSPWALPHEMRNEILN